MSDWEKLGEHQRRMARDCYGLARAAGRQLQALVDELGDLASTCGRRELESLEKELEVMHDAVDSFETKLGEMRDRLARLSEAGQ